MMKKKKQIIALLLIIIGYVVIYREMSQLPGKKTLSQNQSQHKATHSINSQSQPSDLKAKKEIVPNFVGENEITGITKPIALNSKQYNRTISSDPLATYRRAKIKMKNDIKLELIEGISASFKKLENQKEIAKINGYYIYPDSDENEANVVYDNNFNRYGVITNEISVRGARDKIQKLADKYGLELIKEISMGSSHVLKTQDASFFMSREFDDFQSEIGINDIKPNVNYGLKNHH